MAREYLFFLAISFPFPQRFLPWLTNTAAIYNWYIRGITVTWCFRDTYRNSTSGYLKQQDTV